MLSKSQLEEIKEQLENSQNPLFFFDNDCDGLCSFLLLQRALGRGKGVAIKSFPALDKQYLRKIEELNPDAIFILDKPVVGEDFLSGVLEKNIPLTWIDHHEVQVPKHLLVNINYYNSFPTSEPVTYLCYQIFKRKEDLWLAMLGCVGDVFKPEFAEEFAKQNPELYNSNVPAFDSLYSSELGKLIKILNFGLKDTTTNVLKLIKYLMKATSIHDILEENSFTKDLHKRFQQLNKQYLKVLEKAEKTIDINKKLIFFSYSGANSLSSELSNELIFRHKDKLVVVAFRKQEKANISIRGKHAKEITLKAIHGIEGAKGGGHEQACGAQVPMDKLDEFKKKIEDLLS